MTKKNNVIQEHFSKNPIIWTKTRREIFYLVLSNDHNNNLSKIIYDNLNIKYKSKSTNKTKGTKKTKEINLHSEIDTIIEYCIDNGIIRSDSNAIEISKKYRHSELSMSDNAMNHLHTSQTIYCNMWSKYINNKITIDDLILPFASSLARDGCAKYSVISLILENLRVCDITTDNNIAIPLSKANVSNHCFEFILPHTASLILFNCIFNKYNDKNDSYVFYPEIERKDEREKFISSTLEDKYTKMTEILSSSNNKLMNEKPKFKVYINLLSQFGLRNGIPPFVMSLLSNLPLPTTNYWSDNLSFFRSIEILKNKIRKFNIKELPKNTSVRNIKINKRNDSNKEFNQVDWRAMANAQLKEFRNSLKALNVDNLKNHIKKVEHIKEIHLKNADSKTYPGSALHLAIEWSVNRIINLNVTTANSLETYHSNMFSNALFLFKDAPDLIKIKPEKHQNIINDIISNQSLAQNTSNQFISTLFEIYCYAFTQGYINYDTLKLTDIATSLSKRSIILYPSSFDKEVQKWRDENDYDLNLLAIAAELSYYAGLRSGELISLRLRDIIFIGDICIIFIHKSKTSNSPRNLPYYLLAPKSSKKRLNDLYQSRKLLSKGDLSISLFGPHNDKGKYDAKGFIHSLSCGLKHSFNKSHYVPHILRHAFENNLLIRLLSIDKPAIINHIDDSKHEIFSKENIQELSILVYSKQNNLIIGKENTALWIMAKLLGHKTPEEGLHTYCHIYVHLLKAYFDDLNEINDDDIKLTRSAVAFLIPNSSSSQRIWNKYNGKIKISEANQEAWSMFSQKGSL